MNARKILFIGLPLIAIIGLVIAVMSWMNNIENDGFERQRSIIQVNNGVEIELSNCLDKSMVAAGIAQEERDSVREILIGTATARYEGDSQPGDSMITINAIRESYPEISDELYRQFMTAVLGCRNETADAQKKVQAFGSSFDTWTQTGSIFEKPFRSQYPDERLTVIGPDGSELTGREALDHIITPISTDEAKQATRDRKLPQQSFGPQGSPTSAPR